MTQVDSLGQRLKVAVIGAGPSGIFAAEELIKQTSVEVDVDIVERLPVPYGLVRYGVAPDHPNIKSVVTALQTVLEQPGVRFLGDIEFGTTLEHSEFRKCYDAIIYATGAPKDRPLGIVGENLAGSISATDLVAWYNGHPDSHQPFEIQPTSVVVLGAGNVALDVCRILIREYAELAQTDMPRTVLEKLRQRRIRDVHLVARRGPEFAKFSSKELRELGTLAEVNRIVNPADLSVPEDAILTRTTNSNLQLLRKWSNTTREDNHPASVHLRFWLRPIEIHGADRVEAVRFERMITGNDGEVAGTGEIVAIPAELVVRAVGYRSTALPGVPFDEVTGTVPNDGGRVVTNGDRAIVPREYVTGWLKRGPSGVIGTNKLDSCETVAAVVQDLREKTDREEHPIDAVLQQKGIRWSGYAGWQKIDAAELNRGMAEGRTRSKIHDWQGLRNLAGQSQ